MSSSFFLKKGANENKKRKLPIGGNKGKNKKAGASQSKFQERKSAKKDEEIPSDDDEYESGLENETGKNLEFSSDEEETETPQDKRLRLAKQYLQDIEKEAEKVDEDEIHNHVAQRLQSEYLDSVGKLRRNIAANIEDYDSENIITLKHKLQHLPICTLALSSDGSYLYTGAKCQYVLKWNLKTLKIEGTLDVQPYTEDINTDKKRRSHVIALCLSSDNKYLALSDGGRNIQIWSPKELKHLKTLRGHRDVVSALVFRKDSHDLYSASKDRSVKIWSIDDMSYVESLFGHQFGITSIDALNRDRAISSGGADLSIRIWKITEESQLIYNGHRSSIENVKFVNDENFFSSGEDGALCLWSAVKKKPLYVQINAHGKQASGVANWITSITCVVNTDLLASGSSDGYIRLWQTSNGFRQLKQILAIPMKGFINALAFNSDGTKLYAAVGQEHRLGRWWRNKDAKNKIVIINLITNKTISES